MSQPVNTIEPAVIRAGDSAKWRLDLADYPAGAGWIITYTLIKLGSKLTLTGTAAADAHDFIAAPAVTATWPAGAYAWQARASNGTDAHTIRTGSLEILPDFAALASGGMDPRSHAQRTLAAIEAWIEARDIGVAEYEIAGRRMKSIPIADLLLLRDRYRREVRAQSGATGRRGRVYLRM